MREGEAVVSASDLPDVGDARPYVESMTADERLTDAVVLLGKARDSVADFIDGVPKKDTPAASARSDAEAVRDVRVFGGGQITNSIRRLIATLDDRELGPIVRSMPETVSLAEYLTKSLPIPPPRHESGVEKAMRAVVESAKSWSEVYDSGDDGLDGATERLGLNRDVKALLAAERAAREGKVKP